MDDANKVGLTIRELLRYLLSGCATAVAARVVFPDDCKWIVDNWGLSEPSIGLCIVTIGALTYAVYWPLFGRLFIFMLWERLHRHHSECRRRGAIGGVYSCKSDLLIDRYRVLPRDTVTAFALLKEDDGFSARIRSRLHHQHSEVHLLYMAGLASIIAPSIKVMIGRALAEQDLALLVLGVIFMVAGVSADFVLCKRECAALRAMGDRRVLQVVQRAGLASTRPEQVGAMAAQVAVGVAPRNWLHWVRWPVDILAYCSGFSYGIGRGLVAADAGTPVVFASYVAITAVSVFVVRRFMPTNLDEVDGARIPAGPWVLSAVLLATFVPVLVYFSASPWSWLFVAIAAALKAILSLELSRVGISMKRRIDGVGPRIDGHWLYGDPGDAFALRTLPTVGLLTCVGAGLVGTIQFQNSAWFTLWFLCFVAYQIASTLARTR